MYALEQYGLHHTLELAASRAYDIKVLRTDDNIHKLILAKAKVHTIEDLVLKHNLVIL